MKKTYLPIYIVLAVLVAGFIIGSFYDFQINDALFSTKDTFGLVISVIGTVPGYGVLAFLGGGFLYLGLKNKVPHIAWRIVLFVVTAACAFCSVFFMGREFFGPNGFDYLGISRSWGYLIAIPPSVGLGFLGYFMTQKSEYDKLWLVYLILALAILIALVPGITLFKSIFHRPRFRSLGQYGLDFHSWWNPCKDYDWYLKQGIIDEEFKSFPSGHAGTCAVFMTSALFLPYINKKYEKASYIVAGIGLAWLLLVSFARMRVGAHFLSDVSFGALLCNIILFFAKIVIDNVKYFSQSQQSENE